LTKTTRDEQGQFVTKHLSSEQAKEMADARWSIDRDAQVTELLSVALLTIETAPPIMSKWAYKSLANNAAGNMALKELERCIKEYMANEEMISTLIVEPGKLCPTCGDYKDVKTTERLVKQILIATGGLPLDDGFS